MILHPVALQGKAVSASTCTRPFTYAKRPSRQRLPFKRGYRKLAAVPNRLASAEEDPNRFANSR